MKDGTIAEGCELAAGNHLNQNVSVSSWLRSSLPLTATMSLGELVLVRQITLLTKPKSRLMFGHA